MLLNVLQREHTEQYGRLELIVTARQFFSMVNGETVECHKLPFSEMSQQEGKTALTDSYLFPLAFWCHRWAENLHCRETPLGFGQCFNSMWTQYT